MKKEGYVSLLVFLMISISSFFDFFQYSPNPANVNGGLTPELSDGHIPIQIYDLNTINPPHGVKISSDGNYILTGSVDNKLFLFNKSSSKPMWNISNYYYHFDMSADGTYIVGSGGGDQSIHVLKNDNSTPLWSCNINESVYSVAISSDGKYIVAVNRDGTIFLFNTSSPKPLWNYTIGIIVRTLAISYDGEYIVAGTNNGAIGGIYLFNKSGGTPMWHHHIGIQTADLVWVVKLSNDSNYIVAGTGGLYAAPGRIFFYNILNPTPLWSYTVLEGITSVALSSDGRYCVVGDQTKLYFFNTAYAINPLIWSNTQNAVSVDITSNGNYIIAGGDGLGVFHKSNSNPLWSYSDGHEVAMTPDGKYIATSGVSKMYLFHGLFLPSSFVLSTDADIPDTDGAFNLTWGNSEGVDDYSIYLHNSTITTINETTTELVIDLNKTSYSISGLPNGDYYYIIKAYNQSGYTLSNCIKVSVCIPPGPFTLHTDADIPDIDGAFNLTWGNSEGADNYSIYVYDTIISEITSNMSSLAEGVIIRIFPITGLLNGDYYYIVVAYNETGSTLSNCIHIQVEFPSETSRMDISFGNYFLLFALISIISLIIIRKHQKYNS